MSMLIYLFILLFIYTFTYPLILRLACRFYELGNEIEVLPFQLGLLWTWLH